MIDIEDIIINKHKGIESNTLEKLGKINILCGKNNSGKSSILQAIYTHKTGDENIIDIILKRPTRAQINDAVDL